MKKIAGLFGITALVLFLAAGIVLFMRLAQYRAIVEQLKSDGHPVSIIELKGTNNDQENHALALYKRLLVPLEAFETAMWEDENALERPVDDEMMERFESLVAASPDLFPWLDEFSQQPGISLDLEGDTQEFLEALLDREQISRRCARVLAWKMRIQAAEGNPDEAVETGLQILRIARLFDGDPMLVAQLVAIASRGIGINYLHEVVINHPLSSETRNRLNQELESQIALPGYKHCLEGERAYGIEAMSEMGMFHLARSGKEYLDVIEAAINDADKEAFQQVGVEGSPSPGFADGLVGGTVSPAINTVRNAISRTRSQFRALRIINALEAMDDANQKESDTITHDYLIEIGVPENMTLDTMTGDPMRVKRVDGNWIVYSVGPDLNDDGGDLKNRKDVGLGVEVE